MMTTRDVRVVTVVVDGFVAFLREERHSPRSAPTEVRARDLHAGPALRVGVKVHVDGVLLVTVVSRARPCLRAKS